MGEIMNCLSREEGNKRVKEEAEGKLLEFISKLKKVEEEKDEYPQVDNNDNVYADKHVTGKNGSSLMLFFLILLFTTPPIYVANTMSFVDSSNPPLQQISALPVLGYSSSNFNLCKTCWNMCLDNTVITHFSDVSKMSDTRTINEKMKSVKFLIIENYCNLLSKREANILPFEGLL